MLADILGSTTAINKSPILCKIAQVKASSGGTPQRLAISCAYSASSNVSPQKSAKSTPSTLGMAPITAEAITKVRKVCMPKRITASSILPTSRLRPKWAELASLNTLALIKGS